MLVVCLLPTCLLPLWWSGATAFTLLDYDVLRSVASGLTVAIYDMVPIVLMNIVVLCCVQGGIESSRGGVMVSR